LEGNALIADNSAASVHTFEKIVARSPLEETLFQWVNLLCRVSEQVTSSADVGAAIQSMLEMVCCLLRADRTVIVMNGPGRPKQITHEYRHTVDLPSIRGMTLTSSPLLDAIFNAEHPQVLADLPRANVKSMDVLEQGLIKSTVVYRLAFRGTPFGVLSIQDCTGGREWTTEDLAVTRLIGSTFGCYLYALTLDETIDQMTSSFMTQLKSLRELNGWQSPLMQHIVSEIHAHEDLPSESLALHFPQLTNRELQILLRLNQKNRQIARELVISEHTVKGHIRRILAKLGPMSRQAAFKRVQQAIDAVTSGVN
jgi:DNA-binding CsgD family transcriptional regulator/transcriptional regulator with GAF, ATPase, and Fis domain